MKVISTPGHLTDHYNPADKTVNLSESVYNSNSIAAAAVAAHEVGHAVQHAQAYHWLGLRSALVPIVQLSSNLVGIVLMIGIVLLAMGGSPWVLGLGIGLFAVGWVIQFVGHYYEGRKPAFVDDVMGLLVGPLFVVAEWGFALGLRAEVQHAVEQRSGPVRRRDLRQTA